MTGPQGEPGHSLAPGQGPCTLVKKPQVIRLERFIEAHDYIGRGSYIFRALAVIDFHLSNPVRICDRIQYHQAGKEYPYVLSRVHPKYRIKDNIYECEVEYVEDTRFCIADETAIKRSSRSLEGVVQTGGLFGFFRKNIPFSRPLPDWITVTVTDRLAINGREPQYPPTLDFLKYEKWVLTSLVLLDDKLGIYAVDNWTYNTRAQDLANPPTAAERRKRP